MLIPGIWEGEQGGDGLHVFLHVFQDVIQPLHTWVLILIIQGVHILSQPKAQPIVQGCLHRTSHQTGKNPGKELSFSPSRESIGMLWSFSAQRSQWFSGGHPDISALSLSSADTMEYPSGRDRSRTANPMLCREEVTRYLCWGQTQLKESGELLTFPRASP